MVNADDVICRLARLVNKRKFSANAIVCPISVFFILPVFPTQAEPVALQMFTLAVLGKAAEVPPAGSFAYKQLMSVAVQGIVNVFVP